MALTTITVDKGLNKDVLPAELPDGFVSDCSGFRFRNGMAEKFQGLGVTITPPTPSEALFNYATASARYVMEASITKVYAYDGATHNEITRFSDAVVISSITRVVTTATLTTATNHGRTTGDTVTVYGALPSQYNGTYVITVTGVTTFTYTMASDPGAVASPVGAYSYNVTSNYTGAVTDRLTGGALNGVFIYNSPVDGLYYWNGDTATRLRKFPLSNIADVARPFKNYVVQLASTVSAVKKPHNVAWSAAADPGTIPASFTASQTNDAGNVDLAETSGFMVDCKPLGDTNIIYKRDARYAMQYIGGNDVFRFTKLPGTDGLFARDCVADTPKGHVFLTQNIDVMLHHGGTATSIADGRIKQYLIKQFSQAATQRAFVIPNHEKTEVWVCFAGTGFAAVTTAAVWNWIEDTWGLFDFSANQVRCGATGLWPTSLTTNDRLLVFAGTSVSLIDSTNTGVVAGTLERTGLHFGDRNSMKILQRSRWVFDTAGGVQTIYHGSSPTAPAALGVGALVAYTAGVSYSPITGNWANARATSNRYCAVKLSTSANSVNVRSIDLDVTSAGKR